MLPFWVLACKDAFKDQLFAERNLFIENVVKEATFNLLMEQFF